MAKTYKTYIRSAEWRMLKLSIIAKRGMRCESCRKYGPVDLHHRTYQNLFNERPEEVELLCRMCHEQMHGHVTRVRRSQRTSKPKR